MADEYGDRRIGGRVSISRHFAAGIAGRQGLVGVGLSFCVANTERRGLLRSCLDAIAGGRARVDFDIEVLVLDNASQEGSVEVARKPPVTTEVIALPARR